MALERAEAERAKGNMMCWRQALVGSIRRQQLRYSDGSLAVSTKYGC
jgi:hypothetical protein